MSRTNQKLRFLCSFNNSLTHVLCIQNKKVPVNMRKSSDNQLIVRKNDSVGVPKLVEAENEAIPVEVENRT